MVSCVVVSGVVVVGTVVVPAGVPVAFAATEGSWFKLEQTIMAAASSTAKMIISKIKNVFKLMMVTLVVMCGLNNCSWLHQTDMIMGKDNK